MSKLTEEAYLKVSCLDAEGFVGISQYATLSRGIGGVIKNEPEDFLVWETIEGCLDARLAEKGFYDLKGAQLEKALLVLFKRDREGVKTLSEVSRALRVRPGELSICGVKDRRALTWQFVAVPARCVLGVEGELSLDSCKITHVGYIDQLSARSLVSNNFLVKIRRVKVEGLDEAIRHLSETGAPNYYGLQRFGITRPISHLVGKLIVKGELESAVRLFIGGPTQLEKPNFREIRRAFMEGLDYDLVLRRYPENLRYEKAIAKHMLSRPDDYVGALRKLPLRLRRLFIEAYSSYIFNEALSRSLKDGVQLFEPRVGDLATELDMHGNAVRRLIEVSSWNIEEVDRRIREGRVAIIMPAPGYASKFPRGPRGDALRSVLEEEGVNPSDFKLRIMPEAGTMGNNRPIFMTRINLKVEERGEGFVTLRLSLAKGAYATSLLRELMKNSCVLSYNGVVHEH